MTVFLIRILINFICGILVMLIHELPKVLTAHILTHPIHRKKKIEFPSILTFIDPIGLVLFTFSSFGMGWQKPYEYNPSLLKDKEKSLLPIALSGQLANLLLVVILIPIIKYSITVDTSYIMLYGLYRLTIYNLVIFIVNLLPVPPLDMSKIIHAFSPNAYFNLMQNKRYIHAGFILLIAFGILEAFASGIFNSIIAIVL